MSVLILAVAPGLMDYPGNWLLFWVALVVLASYVAYRSVKAYREGRMERVKPPGPRSESNSAPLE
jgi:hypothetical protein